MDSGDYMALWIIGHEPFVGLFQKSDGTIQEDAETTSVESCEKPTKYLAKIRMFLQVTRTMFRFFSYFCRVVTLLDITTNDFHTYKTPKIRL